jgi:hypothetical protein
LDGDLIPAQQSGGAFLGRQMEVRPQFHRACQAGNSAERGKNMFGRGIVFIGHGIVLPVAKPGKTEAFPPPAIEAGLGVIDHRIEVRVAAEQIGVLRGESDAGRAALAQLVEDGGAEQVVANPAGPLEEMARKTQPGSIEPARGAAEDFLGEFGLPEHGVGGASVQRN